MLLTRFLFSSQLNGRWTIPKIGLNFLMNQLIDCTNLVASCGGGKIGLDRGDDRWAEHLDEGLRLRFPVLPPPWHVGVDILSWICSRQHSQNWKLHRTAILVWFESKRTETSRQIKKIQTTNFVGRVQIWPRAFLLHLTRFEILSGNTFDIYSTLVTEKERKIAFIYSACCFM